MDKDVRRDGATILPFPARDAHRPAERPGSMARTPVPPDADFDIDAWYHQAAIEETRAPAKQ